MTFWNRKMDRDAGGEEDGTVDNSHHHTTNPSGRTHKSSPNVLFALQKPPGLSNIYSASPSQSESPPFPPAYNSPAFLSTSPQIYPPIPIISQTTPITQLQVPAVSLQAFTSDHSLFIRPFRAHITIRVCTATAHRGHLSRLFSHIPPFRAPHAYTFCRLLFWAVYKGRVGGEGA